MKEEKVTCYFVFKLGRCPKPRTRREARVIAYNWADEGLIVFVYVFCKKRRVDFLLFISHDDWREDVKWPGDIL